MSMYTDCLGKEWQINLTIGLTKRIRSVTGVDVLRLFEKDSQDLIRLSSDPMKIVSIVSMCNNDHDHSVIEDGLDADTMDRFTQALLEAVISFFPNRSLAAKMRERFHEMYQKAGEMAATELDKKITTALSMSLPELSA